MSNLPLKFHDQRGVILPGLVLVMLIITTSTLALATFAVNHFSRTTNAVFTDNSLLTAEAGAEQTLYELNQNSSFSGYASEQEFINNDNQGRATYQTEVVDGNISNEKLITSTGRVYRRPTDTEPFVERTVRLTVVGTTTGGYSVQTGPGGLIMTNSATISNGEVYTNGYLTMSNAARIGGPTNPVKVSVAHVNCPAGGGASYPSQCSSGQPVTINNSAHIYGEVCATNQTNGNKMSHTGLQSGCTAPPVSMPAHDRQAQINAISNTISGSQASCSGLGIEVWEDNTHITGNVDVRNICLVIVKGDVWIDGDLEMKNIGTIVVDNSVTERPNIMIDGPGLALSNASLILPNSSGIAPQFITYRSAAACSPSCSDVTGIDLYNSKDIVTIDLSNASLAAGSVFYARWTKVRLENSGSIGALAGQTVELKNAGNVSFGTQLSSGQSIWSIKNYQQLFE